MAPRVRSICPPGVFCITPGVLILLGLFLVAVAAYLLYYKSDLRFVPLVKEVEQQQPQRPLNINIQTSTPSSLPVRPQRIWNNGVEYPVRGSIASIPIGIPTQGLPEAYQSMGLLKTDDGQLLPLYGRRLASRSDRFQYYTRTDTFNPVPLPISYKRRDCQDDIGCDELSSGDAIHIIPTGQHAKATLYRFDGPVYVPGLM